MSRLLTLLRRKPSMKFTLTSLSGCVLWLDAAEGVYTDAATGFDRDLSQYLKADGGAMSIATGACESFTLGGWFYFEEDSGLQVLASRAENYDVQEYSLYYIGGEGMTFAIGDMGGSLQTLTLGGALPTNTWHYIVAWQNGNDTTMNFQVNNGPVMSQTSELIQTGGASSAFMLGAMNPNTPEFFFDGRMDSWAFWNRVLTPTERTNLYNSGKGLTLAQADGTSLMDGLISWWDLGEIMEEDIRLDLVGGNNLYPYNGATKVGGIAKARAITGESVAFWEDISPANNHAMQTNMAARPSYDADNFLLSYDGVDDKLTSPLSFAGPDYTVVAVHALQSVGAAAQAVIQGGDGPHLGTVYTAGDNYWGASDGMGTDSLAYVGPVTGGEGTVIQVLWHETGDTWMTHFNGSEGEMESTPYALGAVSVGSDAHPLHSNVYEIIAYNRALSYSERGRLESYLSQKYGITLL